MSDATAPLEVAYSSRRQLPPILALAGMTVALTAMMLLTDVPLPLLVAVGAVFVTILIIGIVAAVRSDAVGIVLRLDPAGVTLRGWHLIPWSDLSEVVISTMRPEWLAGAKRNEVLAFVPRAGVELPGPPSNGRRPQQWGARLRQRWYGTNLTMLTSAMTASADEIAAAASRWGELPTRRLPYRPVRRWGIILLTGILGGFLIGLVVAGLRLLLE